MRQQAPTEHRSTVVAFRLPSRLARAVEEASERDGNPVSATLRRLISGGLSKTSEGLNRRQHIERGQQRGNHW